MTRTALFYTMVDPRQHGGVEEVMRSVMDRCHGEGQRVVEVRLARTDEARREMQALPAPPWTRIVLSGPKALRGLRMAAILARWRPDVVNAHFVTAGLALLVPLQRVFRYRLVLSGHGSDIFRAPAGSVGRLGALLRSGDAVTVVSAGMRAFVESRYGVASERLTLILNGVDHAYWAQAVRADHTGKSIVGTARLEPIKGFDILLEAMALLRDRGETWHLTLAGDGSERGALEAQADRLGIRDQVDFAGFMPHDELRKTYGRSRLFAMPSRGEGLPVALLEAMAAGLPYVVSDVDGNAEIAVPEAGRLVAPENPAALADAISEMGAPGIAEAAGVAARARAAAFSRAETVGRYVDVLDGRSA